MGSHVASKIVRCCARVVALCANKGLLSAVNSHVDFQLRRYITRMAALVALVIFLCIRREIIDIKLTGHLAFWQVLWVTMFWDN